MYLYSADDTCVCTSSRWVVVAAMIYAQQVPWNQELHCNCCVYFFVWSHTNQQNTNQQRFQFCILVFVQVFESKLQLFEDCIEAPKFPTIQLQIVVSPRLQLVSSQLLTLRKIAPNCQTKAPYPVCQRNPAAKKLCRTRKEIVCSAFASFKLVVEALRIPANWSSKKRWVNRLSSS